MTISLRYSDDGELLAIDVYSGTDLQPCTSLELNDADECLDIGTALIARARQLMKERQWHTTG